MKEALIAYAIAITVAVIIAIIGIIGVSIFCEKIESLDTWQDWDDDVTNGETIHGNQEPTKMYCDDGCCGD